MVNEDRFSTLVSSMNGGQEVLVVAGSFATFQRYENLYKNAGIKADKEVNRWKRVNKPELKIIFTLTMPLKVAWSNDIKIFQNEDHYLDLFLYIQLIY